MTKQTAKVKALYTKHAIGPKVLEDHWAVKANGIVSIRYPDGRSQQIQDGENHEYGKVEFNEKLIKLGEYSIPLFECKDPNVSLAPSYARSTRAKKGQPKVFMYETHEGGKDVIKRLEEGKTHPQLGKVEVLPNGHLKVGSNLITVAPKQYEILFKADIDYQDELYKTSKGVKPYKASMVTKIPGGEEHWIHGYYFPAQLVKKTVNGKEEQIYQGASFKEYGPDGNLYETARFNDRQQSSEKDPSGHADKVAIVSVRSLEDAVRSAQIRSEYMDITERMKHVSEVVDKLGSKFSKEDHPLYDKDDEKKLQSLREERESIQRKNRSQAMRFSFMFGENTMKKHIAMNKSKGIKQEWGSSGP